MSGGRHYAHAAPFSFVHGFKTITMKKLFLILLLAAFSASAQTAKTKNFNLDDGLALSGYDPVGYLVDKKAEKGNAQFTASYQGVKYRFATAAHKALFVQSPESYLPQYGGWCAYAMGASGEKVDVDPETFKILDGKLYLFYNAYFNNTLKSWNKDEARLRKNADANWKKIAP